MKRKRPAPPDPQRPFESNFLDEFETPREACDDLAPVIAAWRARHPALLDTTTAAATAFPWAQLPQRLRAEEDGRLRALKARLADGAGLEHAARAAWVRRLVDVEAVGGRPRPRGCAHAYTSTKRRWLRQSP